MDQRDQAETAKDRASKHFANLEGGVTQSLLQWKTLGPPSSALPFAFRHTPRFPLSPSNGTLRGLERSPGFAFQHLRLDFFMHWIIGLGTPFPDPPRTV